MLIWFFVQHRWWVSHSRSLSNW